MADISKININDIPIQFRRRRNKGDDFLEGGKI